MNTGVGYHFLLQGIFPTQESNPHLLAAPAWAGRFFTTEPSGKPEGLGSYLPNGIYVFTWLLESRVGNNWCTWSIICSCKEILNILWKDWCWSWSFLTLATWCEEQTYWKKSWCWERLKAGGEGGNRGCLQESFPWEDSALNGLGEFSLQFLPPLWVSFLFLVSCLYFSNVYVVHILQTSH